MKTLTLDTIKPKISVTITGFTNAAHNQDKLLALGLTPGTVIKVLRLAPLGDPLQINVRGANLSLRKTEARCIIVELIQ